MLQIFMPLDEVPENRPFLAKLGAFLKEAQQLHTLELSFQSQILIDLSHLLADLNFPRIRVLLLETTSICPKAAAIFFHAHPGLEVIRFHAGNLELNAVKPGAFDRLLSFGPIRDGTITELSRIGTPIIEEYAFMEADAVSLVDQISKAKTRPIWVPPTLRRLAVCNVSPLDMMHPMEVGHHIMVVDDAESSWRTEDF